MSAAWRSTLYKPKALPVEPVKPFVDPVIPETWVKPAVISLKAEDYKLTGFFTVNGKVLSGKPAPREMAGHSFTTAMLAFSETWIRA